MIRASLALFGLATVATVTAGVAVVLLVAQKLGLAPKPLRRRAHRYPSRAARVEAKRRRTRHVERHAAWSGRGGVA